MDKKEILQKSRNEKINEYEEKVLNDSHNFSRFIIIGISIVFLIINTVYSDINGLEKGIPNFDYAAILMSLVSYQYIYKYMRMKENNNLLKGIVFALICIVFIYLYIINL